MNKKKQITNLGLLIEKKGFEVLSSLDYKSICTPLIINDWIGNGGKLGYDGLASRYSLTKKQIRTIISNWKKRTENVTETDTAKR